jgi:predicted ATPase/DNA-binding SARP family transcriptional activator
MGLAWRSHRRVSAVSTACGSRSGRETLPHEAVVSENVGILGLLEVRVDGRLVEIVVGKQRSLLVRLALAAPGFVSVDALIDDLWPEAGMARGRRSAQVTLSRLRATLGEAASVIETVRSGYRLTLEPEGLDAVRFERLIREGERARSSGEPAAARGLLDQALELWRGEPLADVAFESFAQPEIARLQELRLLALEERFEAALALGEHRSVVGELERAVTEYPGRERLLDQLMRALYRCGRQADALAAYRDGRRRFDEELGLELSAELRQLEQAILRQDPALDAPVPREPTSRLSVPVPPTPIIGRDGDIRAVQALLATEEVRLVTLTGPGGVGKTRLALELAHTTGGRFSEGGAFVSLGEVSDAAGVPSAVAAALGLTPVRGESIGEALERFLSGPSLLLVLDNFEHVTAAAPLVTRLLGACPHLSMLVTSREPLQLRGERIQRIEPLPVPPLDASRAELDAAPAAALFLERAREHGPLELSVDDITAVADICRRLDGLPLALELAAAHLTVLSPAQLAVRLVDALAVLTRGPRDAPTRQRTLQAAIDWSHDRLDVRLRAAFAGVAVFPAGATIEAAETVTGASLQELEALADRSLLRVTRPPGMATRLTMLATMREYAAAQLDGRTDRDEIHERHARWFLELAETAEQELSGVDSAAWMRCLAVELPNLRAAFDWWIPRDTASALRLATGSANTGGGSRLTKASSSSIARSQTQAMKCPLRHARGDGGPTVGCSPPIHSAAPTRSHQPSSSTVKQVMTVASPLASSNSRAAPRSSATSRACASSPTRR